MTIKPIILVGAGGHGRACIDVIEQQGHFTIVGLVGRSDEVGTSVLGYPVLGTDADLPELRHKSPNALVTLGQIKTPNHRIRLFELLVQMGFCLPTIFSPQAYVSRHSRVGEGTIVMHGALVNAGASVGRNCILNTRAVVEHDVVIGDHCHVSTTVIINGGTQVGAGTFIGSNSSLREQIRVGQNCLIGMGQQVLRDVEDGSRVLNK
ncbi:acetyltransferase [Moorena producens]|uniref:acetyltransferase n=1 Tax=Moorena producens TaxID=1155739 RepID=UPI001931071F|nr:acetyltransferase [Moorena producens]